MPQGWRKELGKQEQRKEEMSYGKKTKGKGGKRK
jgi:hypothetical protein